MLIYLRPDDFPALWVGFLGWTGLRRNLQFHAIHIDLQRCILRAEFIGLGGLFPILWRPRVAHWSTPASQGTPKPRDLILWIPRPPEARATSPMAITSV